MKKSTLDSCCNIGEFQFSIEACLNRWIFSPPVSCLRQMESERRCNGRDPNDRSRKCEDSENKFHVFISLSVGKRSLQAVTSNGNNNRPYAYGTRLAVPQLITLFSSSSEAGPSSALHTPTDDRY